MKDSQESDKRKQENMISSSLRNNLMNALGASDQFVSPDVAAMKNKNSDGSQSSQVNKSMTGILFGKLGSAVNKIWGSKDSNRNSARESFKKSSTSSRLNESNENNLPMRARMERNLGP